MRVQGPHGANPQNLPGGPGGARPTPQRPGDIGAAPETRLSALCQGYVAKASACEGLNAEAVRDARRMLEAGELDTADGARRAADRLLDLGI